MWCDCSLSQQQILEFPCPLNHFENTYDIAGHLTFQKFLFRVKNCSNRQTLCSTQHSQIASYRIFYCPEFFVSKNLLLSEINRTMQSFFTFHCIQHTVECQWLEHLWDHDNLFEIWVFWATEGESLCQVRKQMAIFREFFSIFYTIMVCWVCSLESPRWGDSNEYTQQTISWYNKKISLNSSFLDRSEEFRRDSKTSSNQPW